jgi:hypothetical protein
MADRASEVRTLMPCPACGRSLIPAPVDISVAFYCKSGHEFGLGELLRAQSAAVKDGLELLLAAWHRQHEALLHMAEDARNNGHLDVAEIFHRHAESLESRIRKVRDAFTQHDSTRRFSLPDPVRSA